jgi:hypothetical protein
MRVALFTDTDFDSMDGVTTSGPPPVEAVRLPR